LKDAYEFAESMGKITPVKGEQSHGHSFTRRIKRGNKVSVKEYLGRIAEYGCAWWDNASYFERKQIAGSIFDKPALHLITVCWFRPWGRVEKVKPMPNLAVSIYHAVTSGTNLRHATIKVRYTLYNDEKIPEKP